MVRIVMHRAFASEIIKTTCIAVLSILLFMVLAYEAGAYNSAHLQKLSSTKTCTEYDLTGMSHAGSRMIKFDMSRSNASKSSYNGVDLSGAALIDTDCTGSAWLNTKLVHATLYGANFTKATMANVDFTGAILRDANFTGAAMMNTKFNGADLSGATWTDGARCREGSMGQCLE